LGLQALENKKYVVMFCFFVIQVVILDLHLQCHSIAFFSFLCQFIVILVWDVLKNLKKCLPSLKMQKKTRACVNSSCLRGFKTDEGASLPQRLLRARWLLLAASVQ
jgi:hypothetical protein